MKTIFTSLLFLLVLGSGFAQKGSTYFYWGYNRAVFSNSNIYLRGPDYAFTVYNARAHDRPTKFGSVYFRPTTITIPQYVARIGHFLTNRLHVSVGIDHMKYVVDDDQKVEISGVIGNVASPKYAGSYLFDTLALTADLLRFEHTDGLNLVSFDIEYLIPVFHKQRCRLGWNTGLGGVWMATRTDSRIFGEGINNNFHVSGFSFHGKTGPRFELGKYLFFLFEARGGFATLPWIQTRNWEPYSAEQNFFFLEYYGAIGVKWRF